MSLKTLAEVGWYLHPCSRYIGVGTTDLTQGRRRRTPVHTALAHGVSEATALSKLKLVNMAVGLANPKRGAAIRTSLASVLLSLPGTPSVPSAGSQTQPEKADRNAGFHKVGWWVPMKRPTGSRQPQSRHWTASERPRSAGLPTSVAMANQGDLVRQSALPRYDDVAIPTDAPSHPLSKKHRTLKLWVPQRAKSKSMVVRLRHGGLQRTEERTARKNM